MSPSNLRNANTMRTAQDTTISRHDANNVNMQDLEDAFARQQLHDTDSIQTTTPATISEHTAPEPAAWPRATRDNHANPTPTDDAATLTQPEAAAAAEQTTVKPASLMGLPTELRQRILGLALSTYSPMSPSNGDYLASLPRSRSIRLKAIRRYTPSVREATQRAHPPGRRFFTQRERRSYLALAPLYLVNRQLRAEMRHVENAWLRQHATTTTTAPPPLSLAGFAAWAAAPTPVNGILALSLFNRPFMAAPPPRWRPVVRSLALERDQPDAYQQALQDARLAAVGRPADGRWSRDRAVILGSWPCAEYMRAWRQAVMLLSPLGGTEGGGDQWTVAQRYGIEAVELVDTRRRLLTANDELVDGVGYVKESELGRLEILLLRRLGLPIGRVRIMDVPFAADEAETSRYGR
ncbi:hypothetical protein SLS58_004625 [Diplodia intermedia]|uniref:Uncharacterized protein n=1 Tax=Diplodia intermedia TaxID=856260 RepID=A0ABR3TTD0_9PEZI